MNWSTTIVILPLVLEIFEFNKIFFLLQNSLFHISINSRRLSSFFIGFCITPKQVTLRKTKVIRGLTVLNFNIIGNWWYWSSLIIGGIVFFGVTSNRYNYLFQFFIEYLYHCSSDYTILSSYDSQYFPYFPMSSLEPFLEKTCRET